MKTIEMTTGWTYNSSRRSEDGLYWIGGRSLVHRRLIAGHGPCRLPTTTQEPPRQTSSGHVAWRRRRRRRTEQAARFDSAVGQQADDSAEFETAGQSQHFGSVSSRRFLRSGDDGVQSRIG